MGFIWDYTGLYGIIYKVPLNPMVLLIIIPMKNCYFIGKINPTFSDKPISPKPRNVESGFESTGE